MATKTSYVDGIGEVVIAKRRGLKNLSIKVENSRRVKLNLPWYVPISTGLKFLNSKKAWIQNQQSKKIIIEEGSEVAGKIIITIKTDRKKSRWHETDDYLQIHVPGYLDEAKARAVFSKTLDKYLRQKTTEIIVPKLRELASQNNTSLNEISVVKLKSRWGSCDHQKNIKLSLYLFLLPRELWTYVLRHEIAHAKELNHSAKFWKEVENMDINYKIKRQQLRRFSPSL